MYTGADHQSDVWDTTIQSTFQLSNIDLCASSKCQPMFPPNVSVHQLSLKLVPQLTQRASTQQHVWESSVEPTKNFAQSVSNATPRSWTQACTDPDLQCWETPTLMVHALVLQWPTPLILQRMVLQWRDAEHYIWFYYDAMKVCDYETYTTLSIEIKRCKRNPIDMMNIMKM